MIEHISVRVFAPHEIAELRLQADKMDWSQRAKMNALLDCWEDRFESREVLLTQVADLTNEVRALQEELEDSESETQALEKENARLNAALLDYVRCKEWLAEYKAKHG